VPNSFRASRWVAVPLLTMIVLIPSWRSPAYSVLTHEQVVDFLWESDVKRILLERYPGATAEEMRKAHAYAYGGSLIQDMGYYPYGSKLFSDLVHYVRSGDFVSELISDSQNMNELAFSLGSLAHYASDTTGHPAVNASVSLTFPKLRAKYGDDVTYEQDPKAHIRTEFGFDVEQVAQQHYASQDYHDFIGFEVAQSLLERAFLRIYGIPLKAVLPDEDRAIQSYRHALSHWIPRLTQVALITKKKELQAAPNFDPKKFRYILRRAEYEREWGNNYAKPGLGAQFLAVVVKILPKIGPLATLDIKTPNAQTERLYVKSVEQTVAFYRDLLERAVDPPAGLDDRNLDTGGPTRAADYSLADNAYAKLLSKLAKNDYAQVSPDLRDNLLGFYADIDRPIETKRHKKEWREVLRNLDALKKHGGSAVPGGP